MAACGRFTPTGKRADIAKNVTLTQRRITSDLQGFFRPAPVQTARIRERAASQSSRAPATKMMGKITALIACQPKAASN
jgi:hypothetical protein